MSRNCHGVLYFHLVWSVKYRKKIITDTLREQLRDIFTTSAEHYSATLIEFDCGKDHVHLLVKTRPELLLPELVKQLKGHSSFHINNTHGAKYLYWQKGYGAFTVSPNAVVKIANYIRGQKAHHKER